MLTEFYEDIRDAIQRESNIKHWPRAWKVRPIHAANPEWRDLYEDLNALVAGKDVDGRDKPGYDGGTLQGPSSRSVVTGSGIL